VNSKNKTGISAPTYNRSPRLPRMGPRSQRLAVNAATALAWPLPEYRSLTRSCGMIASAVPAERQASATIAPSGAPLTFEAKDPYWMRIVSPLFQYEPDIMNCALGAASRGFNTFVDGGANIGFWSVALSDTFPSVLSIEATQHNHEQLVLNTAKLESVTVHYRALWNASGHSVSMTVPVANHPAAHVAELGAGEAPAEATVETVTLDDLLGNVSSAGLARTLIKLDIEGAETRALEGASRVLAAGAAVILEDHAKDLDCISFQSAQRLVPEATIAFLTRGGAVEIKSVKELLSLKRQKGTGYNILAVSSQSTHGLSLMSDLIGSNNESFQQRVWRLTGRLL